MYYKPRQKSPCNREYNYHVSIKIEHPPFKRF